VKSTDAGAAGAGPQSVRETIARALASGEWPWSEPLRTDAAFIDGLAELAEACRESGVSELSLAASIAEEHSERSAVARLLLHVHRNVPRGDLAVSRPSERAFDVGAMLIAWTNELMRTPSLPSPRARAGEQSSAAIAQWFSELPTEDTWEWPAPEPARTLLAPPMTFSASRLNGFVKCPRRWFYEYLCDAVPDEGSAATTYGKVFHEALEALHRMIKRPADFSGNFILECLHEELDLAFERNQSEFGSRLEFEVSRSRARDVVAHYARWLSAEARDHPMQIEAVESLQRWTMGGHEFVGFIDRIDRPVDGGPITIYDYKTGRVDEDPSEYVAAVRRGDEAQLALYYTVRRMRGDGVGRLALVSLRDPRDPVWVLALDVTDEDGRAILQRDERSGILRAACSPADIAAGVDALLSRADLLTKQGLEHFVPGADPPCMHCDYARACRERPDDGERVFAR
jgi:RecB family exonuclease